MTVTELVIKLITALAWNYTRTMSFQHAIQFVSDIRVACLQLIKDLDADRA